MKFFRFMSFKELDKFLLGNVLENNIKFSEYNAKTNSSGFCFMSFQELKPEFSYNFLSGVVSNDVCVIFETKNKLKKTYGIYADPFGGFFDTITQNEYCINKYSNKNFKIIQLAFPSHKETWEWYTDIKQFKKEYDRMHKQKLFQEKQQKEINKKIIDLKKTKWKNLNEFIQKVNNLSSLDVKIEDKYYKLPAHINELSADSELITINLDILLKI